MSQKLPSRVDYRFKILYAVGIIQIVAGHCSGGGISLLHDWFPPYAYHLGLFAFCSGYFYKNETENNLGQYILRKVKSLLIPLYIWNLVYAVVVSVLELFGIQIGAGVNLYKLILAPIVDGHQFVYNLGGWYIIPLFMLEVFNATFRKLVRKLPIHGKETCYFVLYFLMGICGVFLANAGYNTGWWLVLVRMLYFMPFYGLGIFYNRVLEKHDKLSSTLYFAVVFAVQLIIICIFKRTPAYTPSWCRDFVDGPILPFVVGFVGIAFWLRVAKILQPVIGKSKVINLIADNTFSITINHLIGVMLVKTVFAFIYKYTGLFSNFDMMRYKTDIWYLYLPNDLPHFRIIYLIVGLAFSIIVQILINKCKSRMSQSLQFQKIKRDKNNPSESQK